MAEDKEEVSKNKGDYALNTFEDIWKYDKARLLDLGNDFQVWTSSKGLSDSKENINEEARARSNFQKLVEDKPRPFSHTMTDATRLLPDVIALLASAGWQAGSKAIGKAMAKKPAKNVARKLVNEGTSDTAQAFAKSKFLFGTDKNNAYRAWVRNLYEDKGAMERLAGKKLSDDEVDAIRKAIWEFIPEKVNKYNFDTEKYYNVYKKAFPGNAKPTKDEMVKYFTENAKDLGLNTREYRDFMKNINSLPNFDEVLHHAQLYPIIYSKEKLFNTKDIRDLVKAPLTSRISQGNLITKATDTLINDSGKTFFEGYKPSELKMRYNYAGSEPTPFKDFVLGVLDLDFNDPARFNEKDIDAYISFLEEKNIIEPGIAKKWTPRQKVSFIREQLSNKNNAELYKKYWLESNQRKELMGEK